MIIYLIYSVYRLNNNRILVEVYTNSTKGYNRAAHLNEINTYPDKTYFEVQEFETDREWAWKN